MYSAPGEGFTHDSYKGRGFQTLSSKPCWCTYKENDRALIMNHPQYREAQFLAECVRINCTLVVVFSLSDMEGTDKMPVDQLVAQIRGGVNALTTLGSCFKIPVFIGPGSEKFTGITNFQYYADIVRTL